MKELNKKSSWFLNMSRSFLLVSILLLASEARAQNHKLVFATQWLAQAQFAGYYVAQEKGFYKEAGLDVEIIHPTVSVSAMDLLAEGKADVVSLFLITALNNRFKNHDIVNIAQLSQHSAILFVTKKSTDIKTLQDFNGKKIGIWRSGFDELPKALIEEKKLNVEWVPIHSSVNLFLMGGIDIMTVMSYNEYYQIYMSGVNMDELNTFSLSDYGYDISEDGLYTKPDVLATKRNDLKAFVEASLKGWEYASQNRDYAIDLVIKIMRENHISSNKAQQRWMLDKTLELQSLKNKTVKKTQLDINDYKKAVRILRKGNTGSLCTYENFFCPVISIDN
jgi:NitT/TauT family transport system substrate-binding protein